MAEMTAQEAFAQFLRIARLDLVVEERTITKFLSNASVIPEDSPDRVRVPVAIYTLEEGCGYAGFYATFTFEETTGALLEWGVWE